MLFVHGFCSTSSIQDDSGGKVNILGGDSIGHCEKKSSCENISNSEWLQSCLNLQKHKHCEW